MSKQTTPNQSPRNFAGFDTWDEYLAYRQRKHERTPKQRREAEAERIIESRPLLLCPKTTAKVSVLPMRAWLKRLKRPCAGTF